MMVMSVATTAASVPCDNRNVREYKLMEGRSIHKFLARTLECASKNSTVNDPTFAVALWDVRNLVRSRFEPCPLSHSRYG